MAAEEAAADVVVHVSISSSTFLDCFNCAVLFCVVNVKPSPKSDLFLYYPAINLCMFICCTEDCHVPPISQPDPPRAIPPEVLVVVLVLVGRELCVLHEVLAEQAEVAAVSTSIHS